MDLKSKKKQKQEIAAASSRARGKPKKERPVKIEKAGRGKNRRFVLIVGDEGAILIFMHGAKVLRRLFAPSPQPSHTEAMLDIMHTNPSVPIYVLADVLDQQYISQTFPPVSSLSVGGLVKRRLARDFQPDDLTGSLPLGRDKTGRKEWRFLLIALAKTPLLSEWLDLLVELPNELKGLYLVPVEAATYLGALNKKIAGDKPRPWQLFISHNKVSGFRQIVMHEGKLVFTRVSQAIDDAIPAVIAGNVEQEIINTIEYLKRLGFQDNADIDTTVIISQDVIDSLDLKRFGFNRAEALTPQNVADKLGLEQAALSADRFGDVVMAAAFGITKKRVLRFSTAYIDKLAKLYQANQFIGIAKILGVLAFLGLSIMAAIGIVGNFSAISKAKDETVAMQANLEKLKKSVENLDLDVAFKSTVVATYDAYLKDVPTPGTFVQDISPFMNERMRVVGFTWEYVDPTSKTNGAPPPTAGALPMTAKVQIDFSGSGNTADLLNKSANELLATIKEKLPQYDITAEAYPWAKNQQADSALQDLGETTAVSAQEMIATFVFHGVKKVATPPGGAPAAGQVP